MILQTALAQPKPGLTLNSGFQPIWKEDLCTSCENCMENCPTEALTMGEQDLPVVNLDLCIGCGVCASGCPEDAIALKTREDIEPPPVDRKALREAIKATGAQGI